jgi:hypothetical protein
MTSHSTRDIRHSLMIFFDRTVIFSSMLLLFVFMSGSTMIGLAGDRIATASLSIGVSALVRVDLAAMRSSLILVTQLHCMIVILYAMIRSGRRLGLGVGGDLAAIVAAWLLVGFYVPALGVEIEAGQDIWSGVSIATLGELLRTIVGATQGDAAAANPIPIAMIAVLYGTMSLATVLYVKTLFTVAKPPELAKLA